MSILYIIPACLFVLIGLACEFVEWAAGHVKRWAEGMRRSAG
jgi:hypothetical protein